MARCPFRRCPFHETCASMPMLCILLQYAALVGVLGWIAWLFVNG